LHSRGTTLIASQHEPPLNEIKQSLPHNSGPPYAPTQTDFQSISSEVYLHIRQHLLAPTAVSLNV